MLKVGDTVRIAKTSQYYDLKYKDDKRNPWDTDGVISKMLPPEDESHYIEVKWGNGEWNSYAPEDLVIPATSALKALMDKNDPVHQPKHYEIFRGIEAKDVMEAVAASDVVAHLSPWEVHCFLTSLKYRLRAGEKDSVEQELAKAERYKQCLK